MKLDLVECGCHACFFHQPFEVFRAEIGYSDGLCLACLAKLDHGLPRVHVFVVGRAWPVDQQHVHIRAAQPVERFGEGGLRLRISLVGIPDFRLQEDVGRVAQTFAHAALVLVDRGGVDQLVPGLQCLADDSRHIVFGQLAAIVQLESGIL